MAHLKKPKPLKIPDIKLKAPQRAETTKAILKAIEEEKERAARGKKNRGE